ncbi:heat shock 70 kDa protein cognate 4-like isoform X2 [Styela clava]
MNEDCAIGIDLGTNFVCVGAFINGMVRIIPNEHDKRTTPAYVAFTEEERLFGESAKHQAPLNLGNTIYDVKRLIGKKQEDNGTLIPIDETWGFSTEIDDNNRIRIPISYIKNEIKVEEKLYPEQITAMILGRMKKIAESHLKTEVKKAVISVPASFENAQRLATIDAGRIVGLEVLELINEPTAAAIAYCYDNEVKMKKQIVIVDFGGGFLDISIASVHKNDIEIITTDGDSIIGGEMIDNNIFTHYINKLKKQNIDLSKSKKNKTRLKKACEKIKRNLSASSRARIPEDLAADLGVESSSLILTRSDFNQLNKSLFKKFERIVDKVIKSVPDAKKQFDDIVLVGGSTRIREIRNILSDYFNVVELNRTINPDEAVAFGATLYAASLTAAQESLRYNINDRIINDGGKQNNEEEIKRMVNKNKEFDEYDETIKMQNNARNSLENTAYSIKLEIKSSNLSEDDKKSALQECDDALKWLESNKIATVKDCNKKQEELTTVIQKSVKENDSASTTREEITTDTKTPKNEKQLEQSDRKERKSDNTNMKVEQPNSSSKNTNPTSTEMTENLKQLKEVAKERKFEAKKKEEQQNFKSKFQGNSLKKKKVRKSNGTVSVASSQHDMGKPSTDRTSVKQKPTQKKGEIVKKKDGKAKKDQTPLKEVEFESTRL